MKENIIIRYKLSGIKKPFIEIRGKNIEKRHNYVLKCNNKKVNANIVVDEDEFILSNNLNKNVKKIDLYRVENEKEILIFSTRNYLIKRIFNKIFSIAFEGLFLIRVIFITLFKGFKYFWKEYHFLVPPKLWKKYFNDFKLRITQKGVVYFYNPFNVNEYNKWLLENEKETVYEKFKYNPLISILIPVYNVDERYLSECIDSILNQSYENFEVCLVDDSSTKEKTKQTLEKYSKMDERIRVKYRKENGHISKASNDALKMAKGEFIALVDNDDLITKDALYEVVKVLNKNQKLDFIYSDEDKIDLNGTRCNPNFKPDWSPDTLLSLNYICHLSVLRKSIVDELGGFTVGLEGAQDHDLFLRFTEKTNKIYHISKILYHWRMIESSTSMSIDNKSYANDKGKIAIEKALKRRGINGHVEKDIKSTYYRVVYDYKVEPSVSIIIPTKDYPDVLESCLESLFKITDYKNYEVIVVNNNSVEEKTFKLFDKYSSKYKNFKVLNANYEFNYSKINNDAIKKCKSDVVVLLNNDTEIIEKQWLKIMVGYSIQPHIGAVGAKLLYPDSTVQHAGVIMGLGGVASHAYIGKKRNDLGMYGRLRVPYNYSAVTAACLVIEKRKFLKVNGLEENLKVAYNDVDLNLKLLKKGYYNIILPQVELFHYESKTRGLDTTTEKYQRFMNESNYMYKTWKEEINHDIYYNENFSKKMWFVLDKKGREK